MIDDQGSVGRKTMALLLVLWLLKPFTCLQLYFSSDQILGENVEAALIAFLGTIL